MLSLLSRRSFLGSALLTLFSPALLAAMPPKRQKRRYNTGGIVRNSLDTIPCLLLPGEFVICPNYFKANL